MVTIRGNLVSLREFTAEDAEAVVNIIGDTRVTDWLSFDPRTRDQAVDMLTGVMQRTQENPRTEYYLAVVSNDSSSLVGFARLARSGVNAAKLGYAIAADHWGRGYASEATTLLVDYGFNTLNLHRVSAAIGPENHSSIRVATRALGMSHEGTLRDHVFTSGKWRDSELFSVLQTEWQVNSSPSLEVTQRSA